MRYTLTLLWMFAASTLFAQKIYYGQVGAAGFRESMPQEVNDMLDNAGLCLQGYEYKNYLNSGYDEGKSTSVNQFFEPEMKCFVEQGLISVGGMYFHAGNVFYRGKSIACLLNYDCVRDQLVYLRYGYKNDGTLDRLYTCELPPEYLTRFNIGCHIFERRTRIGKKKYKPRWYGIIRGFPVAYIKEVNPGLYINGSMHDKVTTSAVYYIPLPSGWKVIKKPSENDFFNEKDNTVEHFK